MTDSRDFAQLSLKEAALRYARMGFAVFPLQVCGKIPMSRRADGGNGCEDATLSESKICEWWDRWPQANIGIATGHMFFVLDVDPKDKGDESLQFLVQHHGPLPETPEQVTGSGGFHYLFASPDFRVRNSQGKNGGTATGGDLLGCHGVIGESPGVKPDTGRAYRGDK